ncbi:MAG: nucleoside phosphorylase [Campylobacteraceae bacterium]
MMKKTVIHTALSHEAKPIIQHFNLTCKDTKPYNIYENEDMVLVVSGIGAKNTKEALSFVVNLYKAEVFINFGVAGCKDENIKKGTLFCTTHKDLDLPFATITQNEIAFTCKEDLNTLLVDMESSTFLESIPKEATKYIFKVVSDYCEDKIPSKNELNHWIKDSLKKWEKYAR